MTEVPKPGIPVTEWIGRELVAARREAGEPLPTPDLLHFRDCEAAPELLHVYARELLALRAITLQLTACIEIVLDTKDVPNLSKQWNANAVEALTYVNRHHNALTGDLMD